MKISSILISQPTPAVVEKSPYYEIQSKYKVKVDYRPFIKVEGVSLKEFRSQRIEILDHTAIIFTSRTTVDHFFRICEEARVTIPETMKYLCNTEAVALYLQKYIVYRKRKISFANGTFPNFMELIMKHKSEKMLLILSEPHKPELPDTMAKLKLNFDKVILSRTVGADMSGLDVSKYDMLVFFSPAEISSLTTAFGVDNMPMIATFGDGTTRAAINAGLTVRVMAPTPEAPSMSKAIDVFLKKMAAGQEVDPVQIADKKQSEEFIKAQEAKPQKKSRAKKSVSPSAAKQTNGKAEANGKANGAEKKTAPAKMPKPASAGKGAALAK